MEKPFFVIMYSQDGQLAMPITTDDSYGNDEIAFWEMAREARAAMKDHPFAQAIGFEIFEMGTGEW